MILIISNERDITSDYIVLELQRRKVPYFRLNTERLTAYSVRCEWQSGKLVWELISSDRSFKTSHISAGYFRRPGTPELNRGINTPSQRRYCDDEWAAVLRSIYISLDDRWLNAPSSIARAEDKALQLALASDVGLRVPNTAITNSFSSAVQLIKDGPTVAKSFYTGFLDDDTGEVSHVMFTARLNEQTMPTSESLKLCPVVFQQEIIKAYDVRVTVVGSKVFAVAIDSQVKLETSVDWRHGSDPDLAHYQHKLPGDVEEKCILIVQRLGLRFAAIDLILDKRGDYWFLESNPNGQWAWIENRTGVPISSTIVDELLSVQSW